MVAAGPHSGVGVFVDGYPGGIGAQKGDGHVGYADDGGIAGPFDGDDQGDGDVFFAELDSGVELPVVVF